MPEEWHFENYYRAFVEADFAHYTLNSVIVSFAVTLLAAVTCSLAGFISCKERFCWQETNSWSLYVDDVCFFGVSYIVSDL